MRRICARLAIAALATAGAATVIGLLAPWWPAADMPNHFRPFVLVVAVAGLALLPFGARKLPQHRAERISISLGLASVAALNAFPLLASASASAAPVAALDPNDTFVVVTFNVFTRNNQLDEAARWLRGQNADIIILQEMTRHTREPMRRVLAGAYPHIHDCGCNDIVIYARHPWSAAGGQPRTAEQPALSWLTLADRNGRELHVVGLRPRYMKDPSAYAAHYDWLVRNIPKFGDRLILAGDFNAAPWSWQMMHLTAATHLRRHGTYAASWPSLLPIVLIDNLLTTPDIRAVSFKTGPFLGSDHLPVVATVALP
jgi:endonuclease/exonuclease/phosphatase (EEP) superfamily protein YafD